ncbi:MAG: hypothetical protein LBR64_09420 [Dysgonamonadaceae bacterium]|jgi:hypothetical protein|nr:hypothetical protein [Dysgonamonadaceae bacterium]
MEIPVYQLWEDIVKQCPDSFVLIENPVYEGARLSRGILRYKNKSRKKVFEKAKLIDTPNLTTIRYTEGIRKERLANTPIVPFIL